MSKPSAPTPNTSSDNAVIDSVQDRATALLGQMTLDEKIGQMFQTDFTGDVLHDHVKDMIRAGKIGSALNITNGEVVREAQRIAMEESRMGIPLLMARDVIHGFKTVMPLPLGQAASFNPALVEEAAHLSAVEARENGINWTFSPMVDISRDARWGRIAESFGEDPYLNGVLGAAMIRGYQGDDLAGADSVAACVKHFVGYGASESGRDYNTTNIPLNELHNMYLPPFKMAVDAGCATVMTSFSDVDGEPATMSSYLLDDILRQEWGFDGLVVSDWESIGQLVDHGIAENDKEAGYLALIAGIDMEMVGNCYGSGLQDLINEGRVTEDLIDKRVRPILELKIKMGLFDDQARRDPQPVDPAKTDRAYEVARQLATESVVLVENKDDILPLDAGALHRIAVVGPLAHEPVEQLGTWIFDGDPSRSTTVLEGLKQALPHTDIVYDKLMQHTRDRSDHRFWDFFNGLGHVDAIICVVGEDAILSGEAHSRADIDLPGAQRQLIQAARSTGHPVITIVMSGRPLTLGYELEASNALMLAWHPGTEAGPALADLLLGHANPSGKLPVSLPRMVGQMPLYYNHKNTGRPPEPSGILTIDHIPPEATQTSFGMTSFWLDAGHTALYPFGHGLSYTRFAYSDIDVSDSEPGMDDEIWVNATVTNVGDRAGVETVQLYVRDRVGSLTRPVRELKGFERVWLAPGSSHRVGFKLTKSDLAFAKRGTWRTEPGWFDVWIGTDSYAWLHAEFNLRAG